MTSNFITNNVQQREFMNNRKIIACGDGFSKVDVTDVVKECFDMPVIRTYYKHGGYIAGGTAATVLEAVYFNKEHKKLRASDKRFAKYLEERKKLRASHLDTNIKEICDYVRICMNCSHQDLDFFFPSVDDVIRALASLSEDIPAINASMMSRVYTSSPAGNAIEHQTHSSPNLRIQLIICKTGTPREIVDTFDITNAMCYITLEGSSWFLNYKDEILDLVDNEQLHVNHWSSVFTVQRLRKWMTNKCYKSLTESTSQELSQVALHAHYEFLRSNIITLDCKASLAQLTTRFPTSLSHPVVSTTEQIRDFVHEVEDLSRKIRAEMHAVYSVDKMRWLAWLNHFYRWLAPDVLAMIGPLPIKIITQDGEHDDHYSTMPNAWGALYEKSTLKEHFSKYIVKQEQL